MSLEKLLAIALLSMLVGIPGCGTGPVEEKIVVDASRIVESARKTLEGFQKSGQLGSGLTGLESDINGIKATDPAKADKLMKVYRELQGASSPDTIKAKAKEMLDQL